MNLQNTKIRKFWFKLGEWVTKRVFMNTFEKNVMLWAGIAQSAERLATGWTVRESNPGGGEIFRTRPDRLWAPPSLNTMGTGSFPQLKRPGRDVDRPPH